MILIFDKKCVNDPIGPMYLLSFIHKYLLPLFSRFLSLCISIYSRESTAHGLERSANYVSTRLIQESLYHVGTEVINDDV